MDDAEPQPPGTRYILPPPPLILPGKTDPCDAGRKITALACDGKKLVFPPCQRTQPYQDLIDVTRESAVPRNPVVLLCSKTASHMEI